MLYLYHGDWSVVADVSKNAEIICQSVKCNISELETLSRHVIYEYITGNVINLFLLFATDVSMFCVYKTLLGVPLPT